MVPGEGSRASSGTVLTLSTYAVNGALLAALMTAASFASEGSDGRSFSGAVIATRRFRSGIQSLARLLTSARVISGRKRWFKPYSYTIPGIGSAWMKLRTNSSASGPEGLLSFSMTARWSPR